MVYSVQQEEPNAWREIFVLLMGVLTGKDVWKSVTKAIGGPFAVSTHGTAETHKLYAISWVSPP